MTLLFTILTFLTIFDIFDICLDNSEQFLTILQITQLKWFWHNIFWQFRFNNCLYHFGKTMLSQVYVDLWLLRHWVQFWQLITWIQTIFLTRWLRVLQINSKIFNEFGKKNWNKVLVDLSTSFKKGINVFFNFQIVMESCTVHCIDWKTEYSDLVIKVITLASM